MDTKQTFFKWIPGRQNNTDTPGYFKMPFAQAHWPKYLSRILNAAGGFDCYLLRYAPHYTLKPHRDELDENAQRVGLRHYRLNIIFNGSGKFEAEKTILNLGGRVILFRPDISRHSVQNGASTRYVFSIGAAI